MTEVQHQRGELRHHGGSLREGQAGLPSMRTVGEVRMRDAGQAADLDRSTEYLLLDAPRGAPERLPVAPGSFATGESHLQQLRQEVALHDRQRRHGACAMRFGHGGIDEGAHEGAVDVHQPGPLRGGDACTTEFRQHVTGKRTGGVPRLTRLHALGLVPDEQRVVNQLPIGTGCVSQNRRNCGQQRPSSGADGYSCRR